MANDDDFIIGGRKFKKSASSQGTPRTTKPPGSGNQSVIKLGTLSGGSMSFTKRLAKDMVTAKRSSGRRTYAKPSKPKTGSFNARGRGRSALSAGIGPNRSWQAVASAPRHSTERLTPLEEAQGLTATSAERTSSSSTTTDRLVPLTGAESLNGGTMSSMSSGCTGPADETTYNVYNAAGRLVLVDKAHLCQMTLYIQGAGTTVTRIEVDTAASTLTRTYLHPDHLGSAAAGTSQSGTVLWREQYTPYGEKLTASAANCRHRQAPVLRRCHARYW